MRSIAIYGKGGVGKSTIVSNISAIYGMQGKRVLQIGCDPKADSTCCLRDPEARTTVMDVLRERRRVSEAREIIMPGRMGVDCIETGGPRPGVGCGGRGILRMIEILDELQILKNGAYDVVIFDVLGDIVCGGFAAPLRAGLGELLYIVVSAEEMAMYAANNIAKMANEYAGNGVILGGMIANLRSPDHDRNNLQAFADKLNTSIIGYVPYSACFRKAGRLCTTVAELAPDSPEAAALRAIADHIAAARTDALSAPTPMENHDMMRFIRSLEIHEEQAL